MPVISIRIRRSDIVYLRWILESHDGLAVSTTRPDDDTVVDLTIAPDFAAEVHDLLDALAREMPIARVPPPDTPPWTAYG